MKSSIFLKTSLVMALAISFGLVFGSFSCGERVGATGTGGTGTSTDTGTAGLTYKKYYLGELITSTQYLGDGTTTGTHDKLIEGFEHAATSDPDFKYVVLFVQSKEPYDTAGSSRYTHYSVSGYPYGTVDGTEIDSIQDGTYLQLSGKITSLISASNPPHIALTCSYTNIDTSNFQLAGQIKNDTAAAVTALTLFAFVVGEIKNDEDTYTYTNRAALQCISPVATFASIAAGATEDFSKVVAKVPAVVEIADYANLEIIIAVYDFEKKILNCAVVTK